MLYYNQKHPNVACSTSWDELLHRAVAHILSLDITDQALANLGFQGGALEALANRPKSWVELAVLQVVRDESLVSENLPDALDFHRSVTDQAAAHLNLLCENTYRTP